LSGRKKGTEKRERTFIIFFAIKFFVHEGERGFLVCQKLKNKKVKMIFSVSLAAVETISQTMKKSQKICLSRKNERKFSCLLK
jgi:hypothetical protein